MLISTAIILGSIFLYLFLGGATIAVYRALVPYSFSYADAFDNERPYNTLVGIFWPLVAVVGTSFLVVCASGCTMGYVATRIADAMRWLFALPGRAYRRVAASDRVPPARVVDR